MTEACVLEALPKEPLFRIHMEDFPKSSLGDLHLFKGQIPEDIGKNFYPKDVDMTLFSREVENRHGISLQKLMEEQGPVTCLNLPEEEIEK